MIDPERLLDAASDSYICWVLKSEDVSTTYTIVRDLDARCAWNSREERYNNYVRCMTRMIIQQWGNK